MLADVRDRKREQAAHELTETIKQHRPLKKSSTEILCHSVCVVHVVWLGRSFSVRKYLFSKKKKELKPTCLGADIKDLI